MVPRGGGVVNGECSVCQHPQADNFLAHARPKKHTLRPNFENFKTEWLSASWAEKKLQSKKVLMHLMIHFSWTSIFWEKFMNANFLRLVYNIRRNMMLIYSLTEIL